MVHTAIFDPHTNMTAWHLTFDDVIDAHAAVVNLISVLQRNSMRELVSSGSLRLVAWSGECSAYASVCPYRSHMFRATWGGCIDDTSVYVCYDEPGLIEWFMEAIRTMTQCCNGQRIGIEWVK